MRTISDEQKIFELSQIWKDAEYNFAFWDKVNVDWDEEYKKALSRVLATSDVYEYYRELARFINLLGDGHTGITFPMEIMQSAEYYSMLPVYLVKIGDEFTVLSVGEEYKDVIPTFSVLKKYDGMDIGEYIKDKCYPYVWHSNEEACGKAVMIELLYGKAGSEVVLTLEKDGNLFDALVRRVDATGIKWYASGMPVPKKIPGEMILDEESVKIKMTEDGIALITISTFMDDSVPGKIYEKFDELRQARGYVIDVRGNGGGNSTNADAVAALFISGQFESCVAETQIYEPTYKAWGLFREDFKEVSPENVSEMHWDEDSLKSYRMCRHICFRRESNSAWNKAPGKAEGPIVVLMNGDTVSAAEDFVDVMKMHTNAIFVGSNTAGTSGQPYMVNLESGGSYRICTRRCIAQNGEDIYNKGFSPDVRVAVTLSDFLEGRDKAMETAIGILKEQQSFGKELRNIVEKMRREIIRRSDLFEEQTKGTKDEYNLYREHVQYVYKYAVMLSKDADVDKEVVELSALLHDISMTDMALDRSRHNEFGSAMAEQLLREQHYPEEKTQLVAKCILNHSSKRAQYRTTQEEELLVCADGLAHFDAYKSLYSLAHKVMGLNDEESLKFIQDKLTKDYAEIREDLKSLVDDTYARVMNAKTIGEILHED